MDVPDALAKYQIRGTIRGGGGSLLDGWDTQLARRVAIKYVPLPRPGDLDGAEAVARLRREAQALAQLAHPNILRLYDYGETPDFAFLALEHVEGATLKSALDKGERFAPARAARIVGEVLAGLQFAHDRGLVHGDVKPANIVLAQEGGARLAGFGGAAADTAGAGEVPGAPGTPAYMSPEQLRGAAVDARTDVYSVGVVLYQLLTGERPFAGSIAAITRSVLSVEPTPPSELDGSISAALDAVVLTAMAKRPADRFASADAFAGALRQALAAPTEGEPADARPVREHSRWPLLAALVAAVLAVVAGAGAGWYFGRPVAPAPQQVATIASTRPAPSAAKPPTLPAAAAPAPSEPPAGSATESAGSAPAAPTAAPAAPPTLPAPAAPAPSEPPAGSATESAGSAPAAPTAAPAAPPTMPAVAPQSAPAPSEVATAEPVVPAPPPTSAAAPPSPTAAAPPLRAPVIAAGEAAAPASTPAPAIAEPATTAEKAAAVPIAPAAALPGVSQPPARPGPRPLPAVEAAPPPAAAPPELAPVPRIAPPTVADFAPSSAAPATAELAVPSPLPAAETRALAPAATGPFATATPPVPPPLAAPPAPTPAQPGATPFAAPAQSPGYAARPAFAITLASAERIALPPLLRPPPAPAAAPDATPPHRTELAMVPPAAALERIAGVLRGARCASVDAEAEAGGGVLVRGLSDAPTGASLRAQVEAMGLQSVAWQVRTIAPVLCPALALLRPIVDPSGSRRHGLGLALQDDRNVLSDGAAILPRVTMPDFAGELRVDYLVHDGSVAHLYPTVADAAAKQAAQPSHRFAPGERLALGDPAPGKPTWQSGEPYGTDMIIAIASSVPLRVAARRNIEMTSDAYLADLYRALDRARAAGAQLSGALLLIDAVPAKK